MLQFTDNMNGFPGKKICVYVSQEYSVSISPDVQILHDRRPKREFRVRRTFCMVLRSSIHDAAECNGIVYMTIYTAFSRSVGF